MIPRTPLRGTWARAVTSGLLAVMVGVAAAFIRDSYYPLLLAMGLALGILLVGASQRTLGWVVTLLVFGGVAQNMLIAHSEIPLMSVFRVTELAVLLGFGFLAVLDPLPAPRWYWFLPLSLLAVNLAANISQSTGWLVFSIGSVNYLRLTLLAVGLAGGRLSQDSFQDVAKRVALFSVLLGGLAVLQSTTGITLDAIRGSYPEAERAGLFRAIGVFPWPTELALFAGSWFFVLRGTLGKSRLGRVASAALFACVVLSLTRWAVLLVLALWLIHTSIRGHARVWRLLVAGSVAVVLVAWSVVGGSAMWLDLSTYANQSAPRVLYMAEGLRVWADSPIVGIGFGRYGSAWARAIEHASLFSRYGIRSFEGLSTTDSFLAAVLPEFGILGLMLLGAYVIFVLRQGLWRGQSEFAIGLSLGALFLVLSAANSVQSLSASHALVFWLCAGLSPVPSPVPAHADG